MPQTRRSATKTSVDCAFNGHDWHRPIKDDGKRSGWKKCWGCGRRKRVSGWSRKTN